MCSYRASFENLGEPTNLAQPSAPFKLSLAQGIDMLASRLSGLLE